MKFRLVDPHRTLIAALTILLIGSLFGAPAALAAEPRPFSPFGMSGHLLGNYKPAQIDRELDLIAMAGASWIRLDVPWRFIEPTETAHFAPYPLSQLDYIVAGATKRGIRVEAVVIEFPNWSNRGQGPWVPPDDDSTFETFMHFMAERYAGRISHWELGNEVNETEFWDVPRADSPKRYVSFLQHGYRGVKAGNPDAMVISAGLAGSDDPYLREMYSAGAQGYFDILGVHAYTRGRSPYAAIDPTEPGSNFAWLAMMKKTLEDNGDPDKKIWITEAGWQTSNVEQRVTPAQQAQYTYWAYQRLFAEFPYVETLFIYSVRNSGTNLNISTDHYGLLNNDYSQKPAYASYKSAREAFVVARTALTIKSTSTSVRVGAGPVLSGAVTPMSTVGKNVAVYVRKPGKTYWAYSSNRTVYNAGGRAAWQYRYLFKSGMAKGVYTFKAVVPASRGYAASTSPTTISIRLR